MYIYFPFAWFTMFLFNCYCVKPDNMCMHIFATFFFPHLSYLVPALDLRFIIKVLIILVSDFKTIGKQAQWKEKKNIIWIYINYRRIKLCFANTNFQYEKKMLLKWETGKVTRSCQTNSCLTIHIIFPYFPYLKCIRTDF